MKKNSTRASIIFSLLLFSSATSEAARLTDDELNEQLALLGPDFIVKRIEAPVIEDPYQWVNRQTGNYVYRFVAGSDDGAETQIERHVPSSDSPEKRWERQVGSDLIETFTSTNARDVLIVEEVDHSYGYRIEIKPGVHLPLNIEPGAEWEVEAELNAFAIGSDEASHEGTLQAINRYEGAFRVRTPAGEFDAVLIREDFKLHIGPLKAEDDRYLFYARDVGLVAEIEGLRASALLFFRIKEQSAKVLESYPTRPGA
jgi:hypothetical protein